MISSTQKSGVEWVIDILEKEQDSTLQQKSLTEALNDCLGDKEKLVTLGTYQDKYGNSIYDLVTCYMPREKIPMDLLLMALRKSWHLTLDQTEMITDLNVPPGIVGYIIDDILSIGQFVITYTNQLKDFEAPASSPFSSRRAAFTSLLSAKSEIEKRIREPISTVSSTPSSSSSSSTTTTTTVTETTTTTTTTTTIVPVTKPKENRRVKLSDILWPERPVSRCNYSYWCAITGVEVRNHIITVCIDEHGDNSLGSIQHPRYSKLRGAEGMFESQISYEQKCGSFTVFDLNSRVCGKLTYVLTNEQWYNLTGKEGNWENIIFSYGSSGYGFVPLFGRNKGRTQEKDDYDLFIDEMWAHYFSPISSK